MSSNNLLDIIRNFSLNLRDAIDYQQMCYAAESYIEEGNLERFALALTYIRDEYLNIADPNTGNTLLHLASEKGRGEMVAFLLIRGANPNKKNKDQHTAVDLARINHHEEIATFIETYKEPPPVTQSVPQPVADLGQQSTNLPNKADIIARIVSMLAAFTEEDRQDILNAVSHPDESDPATQSSSPPSPAK